jgi:hypothetical protein
MQSQTVVFDAAPCRPTPMLQPAHPGHSVAVPMLQADSYSESDTEVLEALEEQHEQGQQIGQTQLEHVGEAAHKPAQQPNQLVQQQHVGGMQLSGHARRGLDAFDPKPMTRREQAAEQQARAQTASWAQGLWLTQQQAGLQGVAEPLSSQGRRTADEDSDNRKKASCSRLGGRKGKRVTAKQEDSVGVCFVCPLQTPWGVKQ